MPPQRALKTNKVLSKAAQTEAKPLLYLPFLPRLYMEGGFQAVKELGQVTMIDRSELSVRHIAAERKQLIGAFFSSFPSSVILEGDLWKQKST